MAYLPLQDNKTIRIWVPFSEPLKRGRQKQLGHMLDVTSEVNQLLHEGKIKRVREFGYGHSGRAGHTYFIKA